MNRYVRLLTSAVYAVMLIGALWTLGHPTRALQDRIAGTCVVPR